VIKFTLKCKDDHQFESWFQSAAAFEKLDSANMVSCAVCGSTDVEKAMMAPSVRASRHADPAPDAASGRGGLSAQPDDRARALAALKKQVEEHSEYVGPSFATKAREMHDGETAERPIHGEAKPEDARKLIEDGVPILPLPFVTGRKSN